MIDDGFELGMYLVGRYDNAVDPFFVRVTDKTTICHEDYAVLMEHACHHGGWWWKLMIVPSNIPTSKPFLPGRARTKHDKP